MTLSTNSETLSKLSQFSMNCKQGIIAGQSFQVFLIYDSDGLAISLEELQK